MAAYGSMKPLLALLLSLFVFQIQLRAEEAYSSSVAVKTLLQVTTDVSGRTLVYPSKGQAQVSCMEVELPAGANTGWHFHPNPCVALIVSGEIEVEDETGTVRHFKAGDSFAELVGTKHCGFNRGTVPVKLIFVSIGEEGTKISVK